ncbi:MAG: hypothetical protein ACI9ES_002667 [Oceanospirillaceae bacterium]|jgi:hypothetical protein
MPALITTANIANPDDFYQLLTDMTLDLDNDQVAALNARLILLLSNHIGDIEVLQQAINAASAPLKSKDTN